MKLFNYYKTRNNLLNEEAPSTKARLFFTRGTLLDSFRGYDLYDNKEAPSQFIVKDKIIISERVEVDRHAINVLCDGTKSYTRNYHDQERPLLALGQARTWLNNLGVVL